MAASAAKFVVVRSKLLYPLHARRFDKVLVVPPATKDQGNARVVNDGRSKAIPEVDAIELMKHYGEWAEKRYIYTEYAGRDEERAWTEPAKKPEQPKED